MPPLRLLRPLVALVLVLGCLGGLGVAGPPAAAAAGVITGHVTDGEGDPIAGASLTLYTRTGTLWIQAGTTSTDATGRYDTSALSLAATDYRLRFSASGYATEWYDDARVPRRATTLALSSADVVVDAQLTPAVAVSGVVSDDAGVPVLGARVEVLQNAGGGFWDVVAETTTGVGGYAVAVAPGTYRVRAEGNALPVGGGQETYGYGTGSYDGGDLVVPVGGATGIDIRFAPLSHVSGVVTDLGNRPIGGITVSASGSCGDDCVTPVASARTAADGSYRLRAVPGSYTILFDDQDGGAWFAQRWDDGTPVPVDAAGVDDVSPQLAAARTITGRVTVDGVARGFARVSWRDASVAVSEPWTEDDWTFSRLDGSYTLTVPEGSYLVRFRDPALHRCEFYAGAGTPEGATPIEVGSQNRAGIDANLTSADAGECTGADPGRSIANVQPPVITGTPEVGRTLTVTPGVWEPGDAEVQSYVWSAGDAIVATGPSPTYVVRPGDAGRSIVVQEVVTAAGFAEPGFAESAPRGPVKDPAACAAAANALAGASAAATAAATVVDAASVKAATMAKKLKKLKKAGAAKAKIAKARKRAKAARKALAAVRSDQAAATAAVTAAQAAVPAGC
ncbi:carboxypeptidase-like regulatory domain-containing protein [Nocardioides sp. BYT-33-1]|uniref:carboxypeptidase-like regulatory domain-containing protein n=1 Tax=Nocardioides sp. BYT-33-1 TaxID=3416952 RepID=UPI003F537CE2